jgi:TPR repeat protein
LLAAGQCAAAAAQLQRAIDLGHLPSRALKAWLLIDGREGVAKDHKAAFELAEEGARVGCHHCQGVMAECYFWGHGCKMDNARSLELARESSGRGSRYGQYALGGLHEVGEGGLAQDDTQAIAFYGLAAAQGLDAAQCQLGIKYGGGNQYIVHDQAEALRLFQLAAAQGYSSGLFLVADCHERGHGVRKSKAEAIRWYRRAQAAGDPDAAGKLRRLRA